MTKVGVQQEKENTVQNVDEKNVEDSEKTIGHVAEDFGDLWMVCCYSSGKHETA